MYPIATPTEFINQELKRYGVTDHGSLVAAVFDTPIQAL